MTTIEKDTTEQADLIIAHPTKTAYAPGAELQGRIVRCHIGGLDVRLPNGEIGFVVKQEISWPGFDVVYMPGAVVNVVVLAFKPGCALYMSIRRHQQDIRHAEFMRSAKIGSVYSGRIKSIKDYGIFVILAPGIDALLHRSAVESMEYFTKASIGQSITVRITSVEIERERIQVVIV